MGRYVVAYYYRAEYARYVGLVPALPAVVPTGATLAELAADAHAQIAGALAAGNGPPGRIAVELATLPAYVARLPLPGRLVIGAHPRPV